MGSTESNGFKGPILLRCGELRLALLILLFAVIFVLIKFSSSLSSFDTLFLRRCFDSVIRWWTDLGNMSDNHKSRQGDFRAVTIAMTALAAVFVTLRFLSLKRGMGLGMDDFAMLVSLVGVVTATWRVHLTGCSFFCLQLLVSI